MPGAQAPTPEEMLAAAMNGTVDADAPMVDEQEAPTIDAPTGSTEDETQEAEGPIESKSGGYTIPYEKLAQARAKASSLEAENAQLREQLSAQQAENLAQAQEQAQARADAGQAKTQADANLDVAAKAVELGVDPDVFGDYSEEAIAKGVAAIVSQRVTASEAALRAEVSDLREKLNSVVEPMRAKTAQEAQAAQFQPILDKHPDAIDLFQSAEFDAWKAGLPAFTRKGIEQAMASEDSGAVIEVFDAFKAGTGRTQAPKVKAQDVQRRVPVSLSEVAGTQHSDVTQQLLHTAGSGNAGSLLSQMMDMSPDQLDAALKRI